ncbi:MAG: co-chaperone GroES [Candidatus Omnitrophota bacterium]|jgi:co-chaperonin GroES (HSP10)|nr:MAG: co-chaperone GroES [Candidatus Omnitrophota bacterium]
MEKEIVLVGDRVLILPDAESNRTEHGLYLPEGVKEKDKVQIGKIIKVGPGYPIPDPTATELEPWQSPTVEKNYFPLQAKVGDTCIFLRNAGIEIEFETNKYIVVPHSAILVILRAHDA